VRRFLLLSVADGRVPDATARPPLRSKPGLVAPWTAGPSGRDPNVISPKALLGLMTLRCAECLVLADDEAREGGGSSASQARTPSHSSLRSVRRALSGSVGPSARMTPDQRDTG
jgi:hypothetical protein